LYPTPGCFDDKYGSSSFYKGRNLLIKQLTFDSMFQNTPSTQQLLSFNVRCARSAPVAYPGIFFEGGFQQIQLRTEDREDGDLGAVVL